MTHNSSGAERGVSSPNGTTFTVSPGLLARGDHAPVSLADTTFTVRPNLTSNGDGSLRRRLGLGSNEVPDTPANVPRSWTDGLGWRLGFGIPLGIGFHIGAGALWSSLVCDSVFVGDAFSSGSYRTECSGPGANGAMLVSTALVSLSQWGISALTGAQGNFLLAGGAAVGFGQLLMLIGNIALDDSQDAYRSFMTAAGITTAATFLTVYEVTNARNMNRYAQRGARRTVASVTPTVVPVGRDGQLAGLTLGLSVVNF